MIAFINANLIDGKENSDLQKLATVLVEGDKIAGVLESGAKLPDKCKVIDLDGDYMLPGFINLHAHLFGTGKPSKALGGGKLQEFLVKIVNSKCGHFIADALVKSSAKKQLLSGVTTVRGVGDFCYSDVRVRDKINKGKVVGARLIVSGPALTCVGGHGDGTFGIGCDDIDKLVELTDNNIANRVDLIKICVTGGVMDAKRRGEPGEVKMTLAQTKAICDEAHNLGYKVASHTESEKGIEVALAGGVDTIEHGSKISEQLVESFIEHKATLTATFSPAVPLASLPSEVTLMNETCQYNSRVLLDNMISGVLTALQSGIKVGLGTDSSCPFVTQYDFWREIYYFTKYAKVTNAFAIHTATQVNAEILGLSNVIGTVEVGKLADLIVVERNPLVDMSALSTVKMVATRGRIHRNIKIKKNKRIDDLLNSLM